MRVLYLLLVILAVILLFLFIEIFKLLNTPKIKVWRRRYSSFPSWVFHISCKDEAVYSNLKNSEKKYFKYYLKEGENNNVSRFIFQWIKGAGGRIELPRLVEIVSLKKCRKKIFSQGIYILPLDESIQVSLADQTNKLRGGDIAYISAGESFSIQARKEAMFLLWKG